MKQAILIVALMFQLPVLSVAQGTPAQSPKVNPGSLTLEDFSKRVASYVELHKTARSQVHGLKPTGSSAAIGHYEHELAHRIRELREHATPGTIFTPEIVAEFRRLISLSLRGSSDKRVHASLNHAEPVRLPALRVNSTYPEGVPLQTTPPSFLANLPKLPPEVEYRVVGRDLVLRDVDANLIVDFAHNVVPH